MLCQKYRHFHTWVNKCVMWHILWGSVHLCKHYNSHSNKSNMLEPLTKMACVFFGFFFVFLVDMEKQLIFNSRSLSPMVSNHTDADRIRFWLIFVSGKNRIWLKIQNGFLNYGRTEKSRTVVRTKDSNWNRSELMNNYVNIF